MSPPAHRLGPGTELLRQQLAVDDPADWLTERHPPGTRLHRLAAALLAGAADLDAFFATAREAGAALRLLRADPTASTEDPAIGAVAHELALAIRSTEAADTALVRLLGAYLDLRGYELR
ncbi:hypothetical protein [Streptomyces boninensis]|uniref:hypothetical protein n=1 Tax=Streptomyces boninensis TaxID=2039455 RepID=UPI003B2151E4